jgi:hypothetical protein
MHAFTKIRDSPLRKSESYWIAQSGLIAFLHGMSTVVQPEWSFVQGYTRVTPGNGVVPDAVELG